MKKTLGAICLSIICGLLTAGLWPFNLFSRNDVGWLSDRDGLQFGKKATIYSRGAIEVTKAAEVSTCSLEVWLQPGVRYSKDSATILGFYTPDNPLQFRVRQDQEILRIKKDYRDQQGSVETIVADVERAFRPDELPLFTITTGPDGTTVYKNGAILKAFPRFRLSCQDFSGQLVIGGSPIGDYPTWEGKLLGLAIYDRQLTSEQIVAHYSMWTRQATPEEFMSDGALVLYSFAERSGRIVHNTIAANPELYIPRLFAIPHKKMLALPWEEFSPHLGYVSDVLINVAAFVPLGFFFYAYLTWNRQKNRAAATTILLGTIISVTIEILQAYIPARMSGVTDIITNTSGTALGVMLWKWRTVQLLAIKLRGPSGA